MTTDEIRERLASRDFHGNAWRRTRFDTKTMPLDIYRKLRPGDRPRCENCTQPDLITSIFNPKRMTSPRSVVTRSTASSVSNFLWIRA